MAARFTRGDSMETTRSTYQKGKVREPRTESHYLKSGNTMSGAPGEVRTGAGTDGERVAKRGRGKEMSSKPMSSRAIGHKGSSGPFPKKAPGTMGGRSAWMGGGMRGGGKMEKLSGQAKAFGERKGGKSNMY